MRLMGVELENYGSFYGKHTFKMADRGLTMVLGENLDEPRMNSNGAAKSSLFESVDWCWYGKPPKGDHVDSVVNEECKGCSVTTYLEDDDGTQAVVKRSRPPGLQFWIGGVEQTFLDAAETQEAVAKFLGMSREVFHAAVFFGQEDLMRFADVGEARRMELLGQIIPEMGEVDRLLEVVKDRHADTAAAVMRAENGLADVTGQLGALSSLNYEEQHAQWEEKRRADLEALHVRARQLCDYYEQHEENVARLPHAEAELEAMRAQSFPQPETPAELTDVQRARLEAHSNVRVTETQRIRYQEELDRAMRSREGVCAQCGQMVTGDYLTARVQELREKLGQVDAFLVKEQQSLSAVEVRLGELKVGFEQQKAARQQQENEHRARMDELYKEVAALRQLQGYREQAQQEVQTCAAKASALENHVNPFDAEIAKLRQRQFELTQEVRKRQEIMDSAKDALAYLDYWVKACGPKGLKSYILDSKIQTMTDSANHWVKLLTGGTFWIRFSTQKQGRSTKRMSNEFNIKVYRYNPDGRISERNYRSWSGGEKGRVSLAIDMGLSRLIAQRAAKRYDVLILDELFKHVDRDGGEAIAEMLTKLRHEKSSVFVIEHDAEFQSRFENRVLIRRKGARSTIVEVDDALQGDRQAPPPIPRKKKPKRTPVHRGVQARTAS